MTTMRDIMKLMESIHPYEEMPDAVGIEEWAETERQRLARFIDTWQVENQKDSMNWPRTMPIGEWDEQYRIFESI